MKLVPTRRTDYAIRSLLYMAQHDEDRVTAANIGEAMLIPVGFLHQVLQTLQRGGLITSRPGRGGGYALAHAPADISILQIVVSLEGPFDASVCARREGPCHWEDVCALHWVWSSARQALVDRLGAATLAQVAADDRALAEGRKEIPPDSHRRRG